MDEFLQAHLEVTRKAGSRSWYDRVVDRLTDEQREALDTALADPAIGQRAISVVLKRWGFAISVGQVGHYRRTRGI